MIEPTVGRVVWYHAGVNFRGHYENPFEPLAAHVASVRDNPADFGWLLNLMVIDGNGLPFAMQDVPLVQDGDNIAISWRDAWPNGYCEWMPYQKGQAARTEQAEARWPGSRPLASGGSPELQAAGPFSGLLRDPGTGAVLEHEDNL